jgi:hypothetical protein
MLQKAFIPRRSGLHGPTAISSRSDMFKRHWYTQNVGPEGTDLRRPSPRRSGLHGPTAIPSRSDILKGWWCTTSDLKAPTRKRPTYPKRAVCLLIQT